jgi:hypothetical protein
MRALDWDRIDEKDEQARDRARDPLETGPAQWRMAPSTGYAAVELDGEIVGPQVAVGEAITVVRGLNTGGLRDIQRPMAADIDTRDTAIAERDETIRELREERSKMANVFARKYHETMELQARLAALTPKNPMPAGHAGEEL